MALRHLPTLVHGSAFLLLFNGMRAGIDLLLRRGVDDLHSQRFDDAKRVGLLLIGLALVAVIVRVRSRVVLFNSGRDVEYELRAQLLRKLHTLGPSFYARMPVGEVMSRATNDLTQVRLLFGFGALNVVNTTLAFATALYVMLRISPSLTLASMVPLPMLIVLTRSLSKRTFQRMRESQDALGAISDRVQASFSGIRVVRSFSLESHEERMLSLHNEKYLHASLALARLRGSMGALFGMLSAIGTLAVFWIGGRRVADGTLSPGAFVAFLSALARLVWPTLALGFVISIVQRGRAAYSRLAEVFVAEPDVRSGPLAPPERVVGALEVRGLTFAIAGRTVLDRVSLQVPAGSSLAIVGRTGSGKSVLASMLPRLLPTPKGTVFLDGHDVCDLPLETVRKSIAYAQQDAFLFSESVRRNVGFSLDAPESEVALGSIEAALARAQMLDDARALAQGLETVVGERGLQLSGGQRQRVALARALLQTAPIVILDDPLSAVDARTEARIYDGLDRTASERTLILITHRIGAASRCDRIVVLDEGRIAEEGTDAELRRHGGLYARFAEEQELEADSEAAALASGKGAA